MRGLRRRGARFALVAASLLIVGVLVAAPSYGAARQTTAEAGPDLGQIGAGQGKFLPADQAFRLSVVPDGSDRIELSWRIAPGYYLYRDRIKVAAGGPVQLGRLALPEGQLKTDPYFGTQQIYHNALIAMLPVAHAAAAHGINVPLRVTYQGCAQAGLCYPPITKAMTVTLPPGSASLAAGLAAAGPSAAGGGGFISDQSRYASVVRDGSLALLIAFFYAAGLVLAFTPCCLPMVPILSGLIVGSGTKLSTARCFALSLTYVIGMALTYTAAGIAVAAGGEHVQAAFEQPWIVTTFAALFVLLALSMFGAFTLQMPAGLQTRLAGLSRRQQAGTFSGVFIMGALSALIVTTCVAPALVGALLVIARGGDMIRGGIALFVMGLGMGTPLIVVGTSAGKLLPRAGAWMNIVKRLFGALMLAVAAWMLARVVPARFALLLWAVPAAATGAVLWTGARALRRSSQMVVRVVAAAASAYALVLLVGTGLGGTNPLAPWPQLAAPRPRLVFQPVHSVAGLERAVAAARAAGRPVMLDFYADWCVSCKEMDHYTFTDPAVVAALRHAVLLRADVTSDDPDDRALLAHFGIYGPPTIAFYGPNGRERRNLRVVGYMKPAEFAAVVARAMARPAQRTTALAPSLQRALARTPAARPHGTTPSGAP